MAAVALSSRRESFVNYVLIVCFVMMSTILRCTVLRVERVHPESSGPELKWPSSNNRRLLLFKTILFYCFTYIFAIKSCSRPYYTTEHACITLLYQKLRDECCAGFMPAEIRRCKRITRAGKFMKIVKQNVDGFQETQ